MQGVELLHVRMQLALLLEAHLARRVALLQLLHIGHRQLELHHHLVRSRQAAALDPTKGGATTKTK